MKNSLHWLPESEELYRTVADFTMDWEYWLSTDGSFRYVSPSCEEVSGYTRDQFYNDSDLLARIIHPEDLTLFKEHMQRIFHNESTEPLVFRIITHEGQERWISQVCRAIYGPDGTFMGQRASNRDITDLKIAEKLVLQKTLQLEKEVAERQAAQKNLALKQLELEEINQSLEERVKKTIEELRQKDQMMITQGRQAAMGEMIGNIAHQWRQPLNALSLLLANIKDAYTYNELDAAYMEQATADGNRLVQKMSATITDFRNFFRPDKERVSFPAIKQVTSAIDLMSSSFNNSNIGIRVDSDPKVVLYGFPNEFSQVLLNLLSNAKEAILAHGVARGEVVINISAEEGQGVVTLRDNGGGIRTDLLDRIFEPYFSTKSMGTGIGLYMSKMIIEQNMEGTITAHNVEGGAEFKIKTPLSQSEP